MLSIFYINILNLAGIAPAKTDVNKNSNQIVATKVMPTYLALILTNTEQFSLIYIYIYIYRYIYRYIYIYIYIYIHIYTPIKNMPMTYLRYIDTLTIDL